MQVEIPKIIFCIQISFFILGPGYDKLALTFNGQLVAKFPRADALKAHVIQFGLLYLYGISYYGTSKKEKPPSNETRNGPHLIIVSSLAGKMHGGCDAASLCSHDQTEKCLHSNSGTKRCVERSSCLLQSQQFITLGGTLIASKFSRIHLDDAVVLAAAISSPSLPPSRG